MYFTFIRVHVLFPNKLIQELFRIFHTCPVRNQYVSRTELSILTYIILFANKVLNKLTFLEKVQSHESKCMITVVNVKKHHRVLELMLMMHRGVPKVVPYGTLNQTSIKL